MFYAISNVSTLFHLQQYIDYRDVRKRTGLKPFTYTLERHNVADEYIQKDERNKFEPGYYSFQ